MFSEAARRGAGSSKDMSAADLAKALAKDAYYTDGVKFALGGQQEYYDAMLKWSASVNPDIPDEYGNSAELNIAQWKTLPLTVKNKVAADQLNARNALASFYPQDLTSRVDEFIRSGQAGSMKMRTVDAVIDLLVNTEAVRAGDFGSSKAQFTGRSCFRSSRSSSRRRNSQSLLKSVVTGYGRHPADYVGQAAVSFFVQITAYGLTADAMRAYDVYGYVRRNPLAMSPEGRYRHERASF